MHADVDPRWGPTDVDGDRPTGDPPGRLDHLGVTGPQGGDARPGASGIGTSELERGRPGRHQKDGQHEDDSRQGERQLRRHRSTIRARPTPPAAGARLVHTDNAPRTMPRRRPRTSSLRSTAMSRPAKPAAATVARAYSAVAIPASRA